MGNVSDIPKTAAIVAVVFAFFAEGGSATSASGLPWPAGGVVAGSGDEGPGFLAAGEDMLLSPSADAAATFPVSVASSPSSSLACKGGGGRCNVPLARPFAGCAIAAPEDEKQWRSLIIRRGDSNQEAPRALRQSLSTELARWLSFLLCC